MTERISRDDCWSAVRRTSRQALACGALEPLQSELRRLRDGPVEYLVRVLAGATSKPEPKPAACEDASAAGPRDDPFAPPWEAELLVGEVGAEHVLLLNKFNVLADHLLIVTRRWADQRELLDEMDFSAWLEVLAGEDVLGFYNGGTEAGASQPHKHMQAVPLPLAEGGPAFPLKPCLDALDDDAAARAGAIVSVPGFPFVHAAVRLPAAWREEPRAAGRWALERYRALWGALGFELEGRVQPVPCNLLIAADWMWLVPRTRESFQGLSTNALGFAGALLVRDAEAFRRLEELGPSALLRAVSGQP